MCAKRRIDHGNKQCQMSPRNASFCVQSIRIVIMLLFLFTFYILSLLYLHCLGIRSTLGVTLNELRENQVLVLVAMFMILIFESVVVDVLC